MKLRRRMAVRVVALAVLGFAIGSSGVLIVGRNAARELAAGRVAPLVRELLREEDLMSCRRGRPETLERSASIRYEFLDAAGRPLHAEAAPADAALLAQLGGAALASRFDLPRWEAQVLFRVSAGPCALVRATWSPTPRRPGALLLPVGGALLAAAGVFGLLAFVVVVRPLLARFADLRRRARRLGTDGYEAAPVQPDEAGEIARALDETHHRLVDAQRRLAERNVALESFLAETMHDIRTPLSSLQLALDEIADEAPPSAADALGRALNDVMYIGSLTQNLRLLTRIESGWSPLADGASVDLVAVAERVARRLQPFAVRRGITLDAALPEGPVCVQGDPTAAEQAIANLVENAVSHGAAGTLVRVGIARDGDAVRLGVEDDGVEWTAEELRRLDGDEGRDERARPRRARGSGLGLTITREVCARSGWRLRFEPARPRGLRVTIEAPLRLGEAPRSGASTRPPP